MISQYCRQGGAIERPLFFVLNCCWNRYSIHYFPMVNNHIGGIFRIAVSSLYGFYQTLSLKTHQIRPLPGGFKNPNQFCFGHALFQVLFASRKFSEYLSPDKHNLKPYRNENKERLISRIKVQNHLNEIRRKITHHKTVSATESCLLRDEFHRLNPEIPIEGQWDLNEFSDNVFTIIQIPPFEFSLDVLPFRYNAKSFYLNPNLLKKSKSNKTVSLCSIPLFKQKLETIPEDPEIISQLPNVTLKNIIFNTKRAPDYLSIQISRCHNDLTSNNKIFIKLKGISQIKFRLDNSKEKVDYQLIGSCEHEGTMKKGHYYSIIRYLHEGKHYWIKCDSASTSLFNTKKLSDIIGKKGCYYFYERVL